jgi:hypothetical protein
MAMLLPSTIPTLTIYRNSITLASSNHGMLLPNTIPALTIYRNSTT